MSEAGKISVGTLGGSVSIKLARSSTLCTFGEEVLKTSRFSMNENTRF